MLPILFNYKFCGKGVKNLKAGNFTRREFLQFSGLGAAERARKLKVGIDKFLE